MRRLFDRGLITVAWSCTDFLLSCSGQFNGQEYTIFGYKGKQVQVTIFMHWMLPVLSSSFNYPRIAEVNNIGGGRQNSCSILETFGNR